MYQKVLTYLKNNNQNLFRLLGNKSFNKFKGLAIIVGVTLLFMLTSALVPKGSGPDAGAHLVNIYCAFGTKNGMCEIKNLDKVVFREVSVPTGVHGYGACFLGSVELGVACAEPFRSRGVSSISFNNSDFKGANHEVLFVQRVGRDIYSARVFGDGGKVALRMFLNSKAISQNIDLSQIKLKCAWPCKNYEDSISKNASGSTSTLTFIPQLSTRSVQLYLNGEPIFISDNKFKPYTASSLGQFVHNDLARKVNDETIKSIWKEKFTATSMAYMVDSYNPPIIYKFYNLIISQDVSQSYLIIKIALIFILALSLLLIYSLFGESRNFYVFISTLTISSVIYGFYIFGTNNTSNVSYLGALMISILPAYFQDEIKKSFISHIKFVILFIFSLVLTSGRTDGLIFAFVGFALYSLIKFPKKQNYILWFLTLSVISFSAFYVYKKYQVAIDIHASKSPINSLLQVTFHNLLEIIGVIFGLQGSKGPLGIWGFGITEMLPMIVFLLNFSAFIMILGFVIFTSSIFQRIVLFASFGVIYLVFAATLSSLPEPPAAGGWMMPRYGLSLYGIFILILIQLFSDNFFKMKLQNKHKNAAIRTISMLFASGTAIAFYFLAARYMNGLMIDFNDTFLPNIISLGPWIPQEIVKFRLIDESFGWMPYVPMPINFIIFAIFVLLYVLINLSINEAINDKTIISIGK